jgi:hypothetical protein
MNDIDSIRLFLKSYNKATLLRLNKLPIFTDPISNFFKQNNKHEFVFDIIESNYEDGQLENVEIKNEEIILYTDYWSYVPKNLNYIYLFNDFENKYQYIDKYKFYMKKHKQLGEIFENVYVFNKIDYICVKPFLEKIIELEEKNKKLEIENEALRYMPGGIGYEKSKENYYKLQSLRNSFSFDSIYNLTK